MEDDGNDSRVVITFLPSLSHLATVKVAISLYNDFGGVKDNIYVREIKSRNLGAFIEFSQKDGRGHYKVTKKDLSFVPVLLRKKVIETFNGLRFQALDWKENHSDLLKSDDECALFWRSNGTVDTIKTVQQMVLNDNIDICKRFEMACKYCLEESIQTLWKKMKLCGEAENFDTANNMMTEFWIERMIKESKDPWIQAAAEFFKNTQRGVLLNSVRWCSFFPLLRPEERKQFLTGVSFAESEDFWLCLYSATNKEEEAILLNGNAYKVIEMCFKWPMQSMFLETVGKLWNYIDDADFKFIVANILYIKYSNENFDYCEVFEELWKESPDNLKESVQKDLDLKQKIDSCLDEIRRKKDVFYNELENLNEKRKKTRKNKRFHSKKRKIN